MKNFLREQLEDYIDNGHIKSGVIINLKDYLTVSVSFIRKNDEVAVEFGQTKIFKFTNDMRRRYYDLLDGKSWLLT